MTMRWKSRIFLAMLWVGTSAFAECITRRGEDQPSLSTAMYHWGRAVTAVGGLANQGISDPGSIGSEDLARAKDALRSAQDCMSEAMGPSREAYYPKKTGELKGLEREEFLARFNSILEAFSYALDEFSKRLCEVNLGANPVEVFKDLKATERKLLDLANRAHSSL